MKAHVDRLGWLVAMLFAGVMVVGLIQYTVYYPSPTRPDAVSQATYPADANVTLPPKGQAYKVVGRRAGLRGFIVRYDKKLYRGGQIVSEEGIETLKQRGIKTIISVTPDEHERKYAHAAGLRLVEVHFDEQQSIPKKTLQKFLDAIEADDGPFYLHAMGGSHRAGALAAAYRVHAGGWEFDKAIIEFGRLGGSLKDDHKLLASVRAFKKE